jgi:alkanesulfonate monooxygenase SsuD/methylene tetrahydromethanopterin reductase-like flavin-dependent oxidoreductase (luciferase family)
VSWRRALAKLSARYNYLSRPSAMSGTPETYVEHIKEFLEQGDVDFGCSFARSSMEHFEVMGPMELPAVVAIFLDQ